MLNIYVCEDDQQQLKLISKYIKEFCTMNNLDAKLALSSSVPDELFKHYSNNFQPSLFFLDINLGSSINGIEMANRIRKENKKSSIVFFTAHPEMTHLTFQYKIEAMDYILKSDFENVKHRIGECIHVAIERNFGTDPNSKTLQLKMFDKVVYLEVDEIIYIETSQVRNKLVAHTAHRRIEFNGKLGIIGDMLDEDFLRCHKSYIINKHKIASVNRADSVAIMTNGDTIPLSRQGKKLAVEATS